MDTLIPESLTSPPSNPLWDKWIEKYPPTPKPEFCQVCDVYSCMWCGRCPHGDLWKCPEEDKEEYEAYLQKRRAWMDEHPDYLDKIYIEFKFPSEVNIND